MLFAAAPLIVPMRLRLSQLQLRAIIVLVISRQKGITLVFKNDPLETVSVSSTFDSVGVIQGYIQKEIEGQLREMFRSDLPDIIHRLSQRWLSETAVRVAGGKENIEAMTKVETRTPYRNLNVNEDRVLSNIGRLNLKPSYASFTATDSSILGSSPPRSSPQRLIRKTSTTSSQAPPSPAMSNREELSVANAIESYDPTYGLQPTELPSQPGFSNINRLWKNPRRGFGDLLHSPGDEMGSEVGNFPDADESYDFLDLRDLLDDGTGHSVTPWSSTASDIHHWNGNRPSSVEQQYEVFPAIGGGLISRPRIVHSQSQIVFPSGTCGIDSSRTASTTERATAATTRPHKLSTEQGWDTNSSKTAGRPVRPPLPLQMHSIPALSHHQRIRTETVANSVRSSRYDIPGRAVWSPPPSTIRTTSRSSLFDPTLASSFTSVSEGHPPSRTGRSTRETTPDVVEEDEEYSISPPKPRPISPPPFLSGAPLPDGRQGTNSNHDSAIVLNPTRNDSCAHIATLSSSHQTLSPFTRQLDHFIARPLVLARASSSSLVPQPRSSHTETRAPPQKGKQKRIHFMSKSRPQHRKSESNSPEYSLSDLSSSYYSERSIPQHYQRRRPQPIVQ